MNLQRSREKIQKMTFLSLPGLYGNTFELLKMTKSWRSYHVSLNILLLLISHDVEIVQDSMKNFSAQSKIVVWMKNTFLIFYVD